MNEQKRVDRAMLWLLPAAIMMIIISSSCTHTKYVQVPQVKYEYITRDSIVHDSTFVHDSVTIREKGDTVTVTKWRELVRIVRQVERDTTIVTDTVTEVIKVERELSRWQKAKMDFGGGALVALLLIMVTGAAVLIIKIVKK